MFKGLSNIELAKLLGELEKQDFKIGSVVFRKGDLGSCMYIIAHGTIELYVKHSDGKQSLLTSLTEGDTFGEMALLTGEARSATAVAATSCSLYVIDKEIFNELIEKHPVISSYFIRLLSQRLINTNDSLQASKEKEAQWILQEMEHVPGSTVDFIKWCSLFPLVSKELAVTFFQLSIDQEFDSHLIWNKFFEKNQDNQNYVMLRQQVRPVLQEMCAADYGHQQLEHWREQVFRFYEEKGDWCALIHLYIEKGEWEQAIKQVNPILTGLADEEKGKLFTLFWDCPEEIVINQYDFLKEFIYYCIVSREEKGLHFIETALALENKRFSSQQMLSLYEWGAELSRLLHKNQEALQYLKLAEAFTLSLSGNRETEDTVYELSKQKIASRKSQILAKSSARLFKRNRVIEVLCIVLAIVCIIFFHVTDPIAGLSNEAMRFIGIAIAAVIFWIIDIIPDYIVALAMVMLWVMGGLVSPETALSGFATTTWIFMIFIMALSAVITKSGILYRFSLHALQRFPANYRGQLWGIVAGGIIMNPLIPSSNAKVTLGVPIARTLSESMGYGDKSSGAASFGLMAMIFYGFTAPFVLTGSYTNIMAFGLASTEQSISWMQWFLYALPGFIIFSVIMFVLLTSLFKHTESAQKKISSEVLDEQLRLLGPLTRDERLALLTVISCIGLMILQPLHGVDSTWVMLVGFSFLVINGVLDRQTLTSGIDWTFLIFLGIAFSFAGVVKELGISAVMSAFLGQYMDGYISSPMIFLCAVILISFFITFIIRDDPAVILLITALVPLGAELGIHPWVLVFVILLATDPFFFKYQSPTYLTAYYSSEGKAFTHHQGQMVALGYALAVILLVVFSTPYWKWLGLIP